MKFASFTCDHKHSKIPYVVVAIYE